MITIGFGVQKDGRRKTEDGGRRTEDGGRRPSGGDDGVGSAVRDAQGEYGTAPLPLRWGRMCWVGRSEILFLPLMKRRLMGVGRCVGCRLSGMGRRLSGFGT